MNANSFSLIKHFTFQELKDFNMWLMEIWMLQNYKQNTNISRYWKIKNYFLSQDCKVSHVNFLLICYPPISNLFLKSICTATILCVPLLKHNLPHLSKPIPFLNLHTPMILLWKRILKPRSQILNQRSELKNCESRDQALISRPYNADPWTNLNSLRYSVVAISYRDNFNGSFN